MQLKLKQVVILFFVVIFTIGSISFYKLIKEAYLFVNPILWHEKLEPSDYKLQFEKVEFLSLNDKTVIRGWFIPCGIQSPFRPVVIMVHDKGKNSSSQLNYAETLLKLNLNILFFDQRNHGKSDFTGVPYSFGIEEKQDVEGAIRYLENKENLKKKNFFILSESFGCSLIFNLSEEFKEECKGFILLKPYRNIGEWIKEYYGGMFFWLVQVFSDYDILKNLNFSEIISRNKFPPLLFFHGMLDNKNNYENTKLLYFNSINEPAKKRFYFFEESGDENLALKNSELFLKEMEHFVTNCLKQ